MRVVYDYQAFIGQRYGGVSRYLSELAAHLARLEGADVRILAFGHINGYLRRCESGLVTGVTLPPVPGIGRVARRLNGALTRRALDRDPPDIVHETYYAPERLAPRESKTVITVYDMIHERFQGAFRATDRTASLKAKAIQRADHVICISENTRRDLLEMLAVDPAKVSVIHLGHSRPPAGDVPGGERGGARAGRLAPYLLYVGRREGYKNFEGLLRAYAGAPDLRGGLRLVCFGGGPFSATERRLMRALGLREAQAVQVSGDNDRLAAFYRNAAAFVYPSLYEGFGIPPLEAMSFGCPVACSDTSALPEVVGEAAQLFDPACPEQIAAALTTLLSSRERREHLIRLGAERLKRFSWEKCAAETYALYASLLSC